MPRGIRNTTKRNESTDRGAIDDEQYSQQIHTELLRNRTYNRNLSMAASPIDITTHWQNCHHTDARQGDEGHLNTDTARSPIHNG